MARLPLSTMADWNYVGGSIGHARRFWTERGSSQRRSRRALGGASFRRRTAEAHPHAPDVDAALDKM